MEPETFIRHFADCFSAESAAVINKNTEFKKLEDWGSMMALIVIAMVDSEYGKTLTAEDLHKAKTVESLYEIVQSKK